MPFEPTWRWRALVTRFVAALAIVSVATAGGIAYGYWFANDLVSRAHKAPIQLKPVKSTDPANYLIVGSDSRSFVHDKVAADHFGTQKTNPENLADVIMIAHVDPKSPGKGFLVSIPRDTWVPITGHGTAKINSAYDYGAQTLIDTIENNFHFDINHYVKLDFSTFADVVNAIGKVHIFFPAAAYDKETGLDIPNPGCISLDGLQALAYARSRTYHYKTTVGYKTEPTADIGRIGRQQYFIRSLAEEAIKDGARNPLTARAILEKVVPHLEIDRRMNLQAFLTLVRAFGGIDPGVVSMVTVPTKNETIGTTDAQIVIPEQADPIFALLGSFTKTTTVAKIAPAHIRVQALNGSAVKGIAASTTTALESAGFASGGPATDADRHDYPYTIVRYSPGNLAKAKVVASYLGGVGLITPGTVTGTADVVIVVGHDFAGIKAPGATSTTPTSSSATSTHGTTTGATTTGPFPNPGTTPGVTEPGRVAGRPPVGCT